MEKKLALGYPRTNILFQSPTRAILYQNSRIEFEGDISDPAKLVDVLRLFFEYRQPHQEDWDRAVPSPPLTRSLRIYPRQFRTSNLPSV